jgi:hypothetical protein
MVNLRKKRSRAEAEALSGMAGPSHPQVKRTVLVGVVSIALLMQVCFISLKSHEQDP